MIVSAFGGTISRPDVDHVAAVREAFWLLGDVNLLSQRFDARLACLTPRAENAFGRLFPRGSERFVTALLRAVDALGAVDPAPGTDAETQVRLLAERLLAVGMQHSDFVHIGSSLERAVRDSYAAEWTDDLDDAWTQVREWLVAGLQSVEGANAAAIAPPGAIAMIDLTHADLVARLDRLATTSLRA